MTPAEAEQILSDMFAPWVRALDMRVDEIGAEGAILTIPITDDIARVGGIVSGQALATLADTAMVFAAAGHFGEFKPVATTNLDTVFLRPGSGERIACHARVVRAGKAVVFASAEMIAHPSGKPVATATATYMVP
ncbi:MAG: PaaI family thioesterase [Maritimibacter harenae]